jgi:hypothetical protein
MALEEAGEEASLAAVTPKKNKKKTAQDLPDFLELTESMKKVKVLENDANQFD